MFGAAALSFVALLIMRETRDTSLDAGLDTGPDAHRSGELRTSRR